MGLLDTFTGGKSDEAADALKRAESYFGNIRLPTQEELTLPELQKYVEAGMITPAQAQSYLQGRNAFEDMNVPQQGTDAELQALNQLSEIADAGPEGTPMQQAQMENSLQKMRTSDQGQIGALEQSMAARGTPRALIQAALASQIQGQNAQQAHLDAVNGQAATYQNALNALSQKGSLGNMLQGQQNAQANTTAQAQNAMQQFNAQNQQQNSQFNAGNQMQANMANSANRQQVSNNNVGVSNARTQYNAGLPQQMFNNSMSRAQGMAGAASDYGHLQQEQGQQNAGIWSGLINTATSFVPKPGGGSGAGGMPTGYSANNPTTQMMDQGYQQGWNYARGGMVRKPPIVGSTRGVIDHDHAICMAHGGYCMAEGGEVPGEAPFPGDTEMNDMVPANLSPGEAVIPRTTVEEKPEQVAELLGGSYQSPEVVDVQDVVTLLKAMRAMRAGAA